VLTPQGKVIDLPSGATPVDFAYALHTNLGHRCRGARVDGAMVPLNHPLKMSKGSVGTPIEGVEVRIASDGEILVRGENVTSGYYQSGAVPNAAQGAVPNGEAIFDADGWLHTGDIGERDEQGRLFIKGRKKEMIVTPQGLNVFPEDVERALLAQPGVKDAGVEGEPPKDQSYDVRSLSVQDPEGYNWGFMRRLGTGFIETTPMEEGGLREIRPT